MIYFLNFNQTIILLISYILSIILFDSFSYVFGVFFGVKKILPKISPKKTYIGFAGGYMVSVTCVYILHLHYNLNYNIVSFAYYNIIILLSFAGDLLESYWKRKSKIKDSSSFLPGHGGFFDRFDGFLLSSYILPFTSLFL